MSKNANIGLQGTLQFFFVYASL